MNQNGVYINHQSNSSFKVNSSHDFDIYNANIAYLDLIKITLYVKKISFYEYSKKAMLSKLVFTKCSITEFFRIPEQYYETL